MPVGPALFCFAVQADYVKTWRMRRSADLLRNQAWYSLKTSLTTQGAANMPFESADKSEIQTSDQAKQDIG